MLSDERNRSHVLSL